MKNKTEPFRVSSCHIRNEDEFAFFQYRLFGGRGELIQIFTFTRSENDM